MEEIRFKPITEGLGLNHFADGLPYSPVSGGRKTMMHFNITAPRGPMPTPSPTPKTILVPPPFKSSHLQRDEKIERPAQAVPQKQLELEGDLQKEMALVPASRWRRVSAFFADFSVATSTFTVILWLAMVLNGLDPLILRRTLQPQAMVAAGFMYLVVLAGFFLVQEIAWGKTIGKVIFGIRIVSNSAVGRLGRAIGFPFSIMPFGIGILWSVFDRKKRCWHDLISGCEVVRDQ